MGKLTNKKENEVKIRLVKTWQGDENGALVRAFLLLEKKSRRYLAQNEERRLTVNVARVAYVKDF